MARSKTLHVRQPCIVWMTSGHQVGVTVEYIPCDEIDLDVVFGEHLDDMCKGQKAARIKAQWAARKDGPITVEVGNGEVWHVMWSPSGVSVVAS